MDKFKIAIIGCPNVGKSTLYNCLTKTKHAIVDEKPGITRDRREGDAYLSDIEFKLVDTPGLENTKKKELETEMLYQAEQAISDADVCLFLLDARLGITAMDKFFAGWLRKKDKKVILVLNKYESDRFYHNYEEALKTGFQYTVAISAAHRQGLADLYENILPFYEEYKKKLSEAENTNEETLANKQAIQIAIVGRPNTGKSTFINNLLKQKRVIVSSESGTTRDSVSIDWEFKGNKIRLIDTAGMRKRSNIHDKIEKLSVSDSLRAIRYTHIALVMIDITEVLEKQDLSIIKKLSDEGRAVVICLNKWDLILNKDKKSTLKMINEKIESLLPDLRGIQVITISALKNINISEAIINCLDTYKIWNKRITTAKLNEWLKYAVDKHTPPLGKNKKRIKFKYITQGNIRPPTFTLFMNNPKDLPGSYSGYLINNLRKAFSLEAVPIRLMLRKSSNPYSDN